MGADVTPLLGTQRAVFARRWWLLTIFSLLAIGQSAAWNFYSPVSGVVKQIYPDWDDYLIEWFANLAGMTFTVVVPLFAALIDTRGVRLAVFTSAASLVACTGLRLIPVGLDKAKYMILASMVFNGISGAPICISPPLLSALWFPVHERTTATAITTTANYLGQAVGFYWGPAMLPMLPNSTATCPPNASFVAASRVRLESLYTWQLVCAAVVLLGIVCYFPNAPPTAPTEAAQTPKTEFVSGLRQLATHGPFLRVLLAFSLPLGWWSGWMIALNLFLARINISQNDASLIGALQIICGCIVGVSMGLVSDRLAGSYTRLIIPMYLAACLMFLWFACMFQGLIPLHLPSVYIACIAGSALMNATIPLFCELAMETVFPIGEGSAAGALVLFQNLLQSVFLVIPLKTTGVDWMAWSLSLIIMVCTIPLVFGFHEEQHRRARDCADTDKLALPVGPDA
jgi:FLVCR family MFS transporter